MHNLAVGYIHLRRYREGEELLWRTLAIQLSTFGENSLEVADTMNNLGVVCFEQGRLEEAEALWRQSLPVYERTQVHDSKLANALLNYASLLRKTGRKSEAKNIESRARVVTSSAQGNDLGRFSVDVGELLSVSK
jgi:tetratricopeptide (TPR) repeat protein